MRSIVTITTACLVQWQICEALPHTTTQKPWALETLVSYQSVLVSPTPRPVTLQKRQAPRTTSSSQPVTIEWIPTPKPRSGNAIMVFASTKNQTLHPAICGFIPRQNGSSSVIIDIVACGKSSSITAGSSVSFDARSTCVTTAPRIHCSADSYETGITACEDVLVTSLDSTVYETEYSYWDYYYSTYYPTTTTTTSYYWYGSVTMAYNYTFSTTTYVTTYTSYSKEFIQKGSYRNKAWTTGVTTTTSVSTISTLDILTTSDWYRTQCSVGKSYGGYCQTIRAAGDADKADVYRCVTSPPVEKTLLMVGVDELVQSFPGMTISMNSKSKKNSISLEHVDVYASRPAPTSVSNPSGYMNLMKSKPPRCVNVLNSTCTQLYESAVSCWSEPYPLGPKGCMCQAISQANCPEVCSSDIRQRNGYYQWVMGLCSGKDNITATWPEMTHRTDMLRRDLLPWNLTLQSNHPLDETTKCPTKTMKLVSFAVINGVVLLATVVLGRRTLIHKLTFGVFGQPSSRFWLFASILVVGLNFAANYVNIVLIKRKDGFASVPVRGLLFFWMTRPRIEWIAASFSTTGQIENKYTSIAASSLLAEAILDGVGAIYLVRTVIYVAKSKFYDMNNLQHAPSRREALLMYWGALMWVIFIGFFYFFSIYAYAHLKTLPRMMMGAIQKVAIPLWDIIDAILRLQWPLRVLREKKQTDGDQDDSQNNALVAAVASVNPPGPPWQVHLAEKGMDEKFLNRLFDASSLIAVAFGMQWVFWVGFLGLYGDKYCPPNIWIMTAVWSGFSIAGIVIQTL